MRTHLEKLACGAFTGGTFVFLFGLATTSMPSQASVTVESSSPRQAVFLALPPLSTEGEEIADEPVVESVAEAPREPVEVQSVEPVGPVVERSELGVPMPAGTLAPVRLPARTAAVKAPVEPEASASKGRPCVAPTGRIDAVGTDTYVVDKGLIDVYADDLDAASRLAWASWHADAEGDTDGFRVRRIRCGSPLHEAGFRNGDVVHSINGKDITTIPSALLAYRRVKRKDSLRVAITRKDGSSRELRYTLR